MTGLGYGPVYGTAKEKQGLIGFSVRVYMLTNFSLYLAEG